MKHIAAFWVCIGALSWTEAGAQEQPNDTTLNRTVTVENQFNPEVMDASKINVLPRMEESVPAKRHIDYAVSAHPVGQWAFAPMGFMGAEQSQPDIPRGYVRGAFGNRNNVDAKASYLWDMTPRDCLDFAVSLYGRNGDIPLYPEYNEEWRSRFFRTDVSLDYRHSFRKVELRAGGNFGSQVFNYMSGGDWVPLPPPVYDKQRYTLGDGYFGLSSVRGELPVDFSLKAGYKGFSREQDVPDLSPLSEHIFYAEGQVSGRIDDRQQVGIDFAVSHVRYSHSLKDYALFRVVPGYAWSTDEVRLRLGVRVEAQTANGSGLKLAPDVKLDYTFGDTYTLYAYAGGGTRLNDFRRLNEISPYGIFYGQLHSSYTPLDAEVGLKMSPLAGLGFRLFGGYRVTKDELFVVPDAPAASALRYAGIMQTKAKVAYGGVSLDYGYKDVLDLSLKGTAYDWSLGNKEYGYLLCLKPQFALSMSARLKIIEGMFLTAGYRYEKRKTDERAEKVGSVSNLELGADYQLLERLNVFVRLGNLLDKEYVTETGYPVQGLNVTAGISFRF